MSAERANLQSAIAAGDVQAEDDLCHTFAPRILRLVERSFANRTEAQDIASEILEAVLANLRRGSFRGECQLGTYVYAIARNKIAERIRRRGPEPATLDEGLPDSRPSPEDLAAQKELGSAVRDALAQLDRKYRDVLHLYYYKGLAVSQIAGALGVSAKKVSEWKDYALRVIRVRSGWRLEKFR